MKHFALLILLLISISVSGQRKPLGMLIKHSIGTDIPIGGFSSSKTTDNIIFYKEKLYLGLFSHTLIFNENWGIEFSYRANPYSVSNYNNFKSGIEGQYGSDYFIDYTFSINKDYVENSLFSYQNILAGINYKFEYKNFYIMPKILTGLSVIPASNAYVQLKKKNSNEILIKKYEQNNGSPHTFLSLNPGVNLGWLIYQNIGLNLELNYYQFKVNSHNLNYTVTSSNELTGTKTVEVINYNKNIKHLSVGLGICYYLKLRYRTSQ